MSNRYTAVLLAGNQPGLVGDPGLLKQKAGGKSIFSHCLDVFDADETCLEIIVECCPQIRDWITHDPLTFSIVKMRLEDAKDGHCESWIALAQTAKSPVVVFQHAGFPCFGADLLAKVLATVKPEIAAVPGWPVNTSLGTVTSIEERGTENGGGAESFLGPKADFRAGHLMELTDISSLYTLQFPQAFFVDSLLKAGQTTGEKLDGFGSLCEMYIAGGFEVAVITGKRGNIGVYSPDDLYMIRKLIGGPKRKKDKYGGLGW